MKPEEGNKALAEWAGWTHIEPVSSIQIYGNLKGYPAKFILGKKEIVPNYHSDLNAIHELELKLGSDLQPDVRWNYMEILAEVVMNAKDFPIDAGHAWRVSTATAPQRWEALLRTLNLWRDQ